MESNLVLVFLCLISSLAIISIQAQNATLIDQTCKLTPDLYNLCTSTLYSDPHIRGATDARDLAVIIVYHVNEKASETRDHITGFLNDRSTDKKIKVLLKKCYDQYDTIILNWLREVREGLSYRKYDPAQKAMSAITTNVESCEQSFVAPVRSPISDDSKAVDELSKIALAIISYKSQHPPLIK